jgi:hypothetical protein
MSVGLRAVEHVVDPREREAGCRCRPGTSVDVALSAMTDIGVMAASDGGCVRATKSCEMPGYDRPTRPTLLCSTQGWCGDRLDDVVPIEELQRLEVVIRAAGAAGAAHVHADGGITEHAGDERVGIARRVTQNGELLQNGSAGLTSSPGRDGL